MRAGNPIGVSTGTDKSQLKTPCFSTSNLLINSNQTEERTHSEYGQNKQQNFFSFPVSVVVISR